jgi:hypothetical protein
MKIFTNFPDFTEKHSCSQAQNPIGLKNLESSLCCHKKFSKNASSHLNGFLKAARINKVDKFT